MSISLGNADYEDYKTSSSDLFKITGQIYLQSTQKWMQSNDLASMEIGYIALEIAGIILVKFYSNYNRLEEAKLFFKLTVENFHQLLRIYDKQPTEPVATHIRTLRNTYTHICSSQIISFIIIPNAPQLIQTYFSIIQSKASILQQMSSADKDENIIGFWETIVVQGLKILDKVFTLCSPQSVTNILRNIKQDSEVKQAVELLEKWLFTPESVNSLFLLVTSYIKLTSRDLEDLRSDREEWMNREMSYSLPNNARKYAEQVAKGFRYWINNPLRLSLSVLMENSWQSDDLLVRDVAYNLFAITGEFLF